VKFHEFYAGYKQCLGYRVRFSAIFAFFFIFCNRLSALISVLCDIFTVEPDTITPLPLAGATVDFVAPGTAGTVLPDFCDEGSVFPSVAGRVAEKAPPPLPQTVDGELFVSGLVKAGRLFPSDLDLERSATPLDELVVVAEDRLTKFLARLARPTSPRPTSGDSFTTVG